MPVESITGIAFPGVSPAMGGAEVQPVLERIAGCCLKHLRQGGYVSDDEAVTLLTAYQKSLQPAVRPRDFIVFVAEAQAARHKVTVEGEVQGMQKLLRHSLNDRVHAWSFGLPPGRATALYEHCPALRPVCAALGCPATLAGETSIVHVASINPVAALVAAFWIDHEVTRVAGGDSPFVFPFLVDMPSWNTLCQRHFAA